LPLRNPRWPLLRVRLRPFHDLLQPDPLLSRLAQHRDAEFSHGAGRIDVDLACAELGDGYGFVKRFGINLNRVLDPIGIDERRLGSGREPWTDYSAGLCLLFAIAGDGAVGQHRTSSPRDAGSSGIVGNVESASYRVDYILLGSSPTSGTNAELITYRESWSPACNSVADL
jgi:hypothetical protein